MRVGGSTKRGILDTSLTNTENSELCTMLGETATEQFVEEFTGSFAVLDWDGFDTNTASWRETRPEMQKLVSLLEKFISEFQVYCNAHPPSPKSAAIYLAIDVFEDWIDHPRYSAANDAPHYTELLDTLVKFHMRAERNLEKQIELAKKAGRPTDLNLGQVIFNVAHLLRKHQITHAVTTNRETNEITSPFWSLVIEIVSRLRNKPNAGCNSQQAALRRVKRDLQKFRDQYPVENEGPKGHTG